jgi:hypothetical protein
MKRLLLLSALAALPLAVATPLHAQTTASLPQGDGRDLVATACSQCHTLSVIMAGRDGPVGWKRHVYNMVLRGAQLSPREADTVIEYLITNFGPGAPAAGSAPLPSGPGKELVETRRVPQSRAGHDREKAEGRLGYDRVQHVRALGHVGARRGAGDLRLSRGAVRSKLKTVVPQRRMRRHHHRHSRSGAKVMAGM